MAMSIGARWVNWVPANISTAGIGTRCIGFMLPFCRRNCQWSGRAVRAKNPYCGRREIYPLRRTVAIRRGRGICDARTSRGEDGESTHVEPAWNEAEVWAMKTIEMTRILLAAGLGLGLGCGAALGQSSGQDMKDAGHDTKAAAVDTGHATAQTSRKVYHTTKRGTKRVYHKTVRGTEKVGDKAAGKPDSR